MIVTKNQATKLNRKISYLRRAKRETLRLLDSWLPGEELSHRIAAVFDDELANFESQLQEFELAKTSQSDHYLGNCQRIGSDLIAARLALNWTHKDLAERTNSCRRVISKYEKAEYQQVALHRLVEIEAALIAGFKEMEDLNEEIKQMNKMHLKTNQDYPNGDVGDVGDVGVGDVGAGDVGDARDVGDAGDIGDVGDVE